MGTYLSNLYLRQDVTDLQDFANIPHSEPDGAHYLNDGCQAQLLGRIDELSVQFNLLCAEHAHYVDEHWIPMQQFAHGVLSTMAVLTDTSPESPAFCQVCGGGNAPSGPSNESQPPTPLLLVSSPMTSQASVSTTPPSSPPTPYPSPVSNLSLPPPSVLFYTPPLSRFSPFYLFLSKFEAPKHSFKS